MRAAGNQSGPKFGIDRSNATSASISAIDVVATYEHDYTPFREAILNSASLKVITLLVQAGANINAANAEGRTPIWYAARMDSTDAIEMLIAAGANVNAADISEYNPLHFVSFTPNADS